MDKYTLLLMLLDNRLIDEAYLKVFTYLTLLTLNDGNYDKDAFNKEIYILENYLRRVNNLKVKIQLNRKGEEIDRLIDEIIDIYDENKDIIEKYNVGNLKIIETLKNKEPGELTTLIDMQTKEKMAIVDNQEYYSNIRNKIFNSYPVDFNINNGDIIFNLENEELVIKEEEFYKIFNYLTNIDCYEQPFTLTKANLRHTVLIGNLIKSLMGEKLTDEEIIPVVMANYKFGNNMDINTSNFVIKNIKITDLYKEADRKDNYNKDSLAKWNNLTISNEYLFNELRNIIRNGKYYFLDNDLILENVYNNVSDFKVSIDKYYMKEFLIADIRNNIVSNDKKR